MTTPSTDRRAQAHDRQLLLWPGVAIVVLQWLARYVIPLGLPEASTFGIFSGFLGWLAILVWWVFFSRAPLVERWGGAALMIVGLGATLLVLHPSIATAMWGMIYVFYATPILSLAFVLWAVASRKLTDGPRRVAMVVTILLACGGWALFRMDGMGFGVGAQFVWRWTATHEQQFLAAGGDGAAQVSAPLPAMAGDAAIWPGFLGPDRDGVVDGLSIETDWAVSPPIELWRRAIGPGWSSFAVLGDLLFTQEQRGDKEVVACYRLTSGEPVWTHSDAARFWEAIGGAGPRGTPTISHGAVFTFGGTGILNALNALDGQTLWSRQVAHEAKVEVPYWGFASSPIVVDDLVIVAASGTLVAHETATGEQRWVGPGGGVSYSSPQLLTIDGVPQVLAMNAKGLISVRPADGELLWEHGWPGEPILQPSLSQDGDLLISAGQGSGVRRLTVTQSRGAWSVEERWTSTGLKPYYSEIVEYEGHAFGFDGNFLVGIDLEDGQRKWKGGRYGAGQLLLLADQGLLLVLTEKGELVAVAANPDAFEEIARIQAIAGKTWNHPVLVENVLVMRNAEEMAAFRLPVRRRRAPEDQSRLSQ